MNRLTFALALALCGPAAAQDRQTVRLPIVRDLWLSDVGNEGDGNNGGSDRLKFKSIQELSLIDIDPASLRGRVITGALLSLRLSGNEPLLRVTVSSLGADWVEGKSSGYKPEKGASSFRHRMHPDTPWAHPGSDLTAVMFGLGGTRWNNADATAAKDGWQMIAVDPAVVATRVAGIGYGFVVFDDTGSEWTRQGEKFTYKHFPNRFAFSRQSNASRAPFLTVTLGAVDKEPPAAPGNLSADAANLPAGEATVSWTTPADAGAAGTLGFFVEVDGKAVPRYLIPVAGAVGKKVTMHLRDLGLSTGQKVKLSVKAVDAAGNVGPASELEFATSSQGPIALPTTDIRPFTEVAPLPKLGNAEVAIVDALDKFHPATGERIPPQPDAYLAANHLWSAKENRIRLFAGRNEFVHFQIHFRSPVPGVTPTLALPAAAKAKVEFGRYALVGTDKGVMPDPIVTIDGAFSVPHGKDEARNGSLLCELYVPHDAAAGDHVGSLKLAGADGKALEIKVDLRVWDFTLPDHLSFYPEMNAYSLPGPERGYYRLAHKHRTVLNCVPYTQSGNVRAGWSPKWNGKTFDWTEFDKRFGPYFDGSAFADLPRKSVPLEAHYLAIHENWPTPIEPNYNNTYWAEKAFTATYRTGLVDAFKQFAAHFSEKGWSQTNFQFFLNGKNNFKVNGWSRGSSPWLLDEPANFQDYWALRWFGDAFVEGLRGSDRKAVLSYRIDISRPQWQRDVLDPVLDYNVVAGGAFHKYLRMVQDRKQTYGQQVIVYGNSNAVEHANTQPLGWSLDSWSLGADGVLPWLSVGPDATWKKAQATCVMYTPGPTGSADPVPSVRLKAYLRGQQDVEYLTLLMMQSNLPRWAVGAAVRKSLKLQPVRQGTGFAGEDAGIVVFTDLRPVDVWQLRTAVGEHLSKSRPAPKAKLVEFKFPPRG